MTGGVGRFRQRLALRNKHRNSDGADFPWRAAAINLLGVALTLNSCDQDESSCKTEKDGSGLNQNDFNTLFETL